jgi:hypothetical protein
VFVGNPRLRRLAGHGYAFCYTALMNRMLRGHSGKRDFSRVVIVAALGRNNGISIGARLQYAALRQLGIDVDLLDTTSALRTPWFRARHQPGTTYVFHSGGPQTACLIGAVLPGHRAPSPGKASHNVARSLCTLFRTICCPTRWR